MIMVSFDFIEYMSEKIIDLKFNLSQLILVLFCCVLVEIIRILREWKVKVNVKK